MTEEMFPNGRIPASHPGECIQEDFLVPHEKDATWLAEGLRLPLSEVEALLEGRRPVTAEIALRLSRFLGCSPDFWLGLQNTYDLEEAENRLAAELAEMEPHRMPRLVYDEKGQVIGSVWEQQPASAS
jgi:addiction module HigA family antidote